VVTIRIERIQQLQEGRVPVGHGRHAVADRSGVRTLGICGRLTAVSVTFGVSALFLLATSLAWGQPGRPAAEQVLAGTGFHGGLVVQVGLQDPSMAISLATAPNVLVHGLVQDRALLGEARNTIREEGVYGQVSVMSWTGPHLPYADGMVNLLLVLDEKVTLDPKEVDRVLAPLGLARIQRNGILTSTRKACPEDVDEWSHARYDATGNAVSKDKRVGPPRFMQWEAWPRWNHGTKTSVLVSAGGRIFYILDDAHFASNARTWSLIARDAYNGIQLWRHELPGWGGAKGGKKIGPAQVNRRLVAIGDRVYAMLGDGVPLSVLDAATGEVIRVLEETAKAEEFLVAGGVLVALVNVGTAADVRRGGTQSMRLVAVNPKNGDVLWRHTADMIMPLSVVSDGTQVVYHDGKAIKSLELVSGSPRWTSPPTGQTIEYRKSSNCDRPGATKSTIVLAPQFAPTMVMYKKVVAFAGGCQINVVSADDGRELWRGDYAPSNYSVPVEIFGFKDSLWGPDTEMNMWRPLSNGLDYNAYDPLTGEQKKSVKGNYGFKFQHHRCHQMKVVDNTVIAGKAGIEFLNTETGDTAAHHWTRGSCYYGVMPANGHLYVPPHNCACYIRAKLSGFMAMNAAPPARRAVIPEARRLGRGPAYGQTAGKALAPRPDDWPTYRHDAGRSGRTATAVGSDLLLGWEADVGSKLTSLVVADNRVYVASTDAHSVHALDALTGESLWNYSLDGRIDSPPTIYQGLVLCGSRDGSVYALRATDGALVWRFRAASEERLIVSRGQLESIWPMSGSVLVVNDTVYIAAGKTSYLDGGIRLYGLEPHTGKKAFDTVLMTLNEDGSETIDEQSVDGYLNDILSSDGERIYMRHQALDLAGKPKPGRVTHMHGPDGYLSSETTTRLLWTYAPMYTSPHQGAFYDLRLSRSLFPSGRILVEGEDVIYGFGQNHYKKMRVDPGGTFALFSAAKENDVPLELSAKEYRTLALSGKKSVRFNWWKKLPIHVWAMVKTKDILFVAGVRGNATVSQAALKGKSDGMLLAISPEDGSVLAEMSLPSMPVWDGMAAAGGNLYLALTNGQALCLWDAASGRPGTPLTAAGWRVVLPPLKIAAEPGLLGRWRFDEGAGSLARDCSGRGHDADVSGRWGTGEFGSCLVTGGSGQAAVIPDAPHLQFGNDDFSLALWVKIDGYDARLLGKEAFPQNWWVINLPSDGHAELVLGEGRGQGKSMRAKTTAAIPTDAWSHVVAVADRQAKEVRWYLNGKLDSRHPIPETMTDGLNADGRDIAIPSTHKPFRGLVGDVRIYGKGLSTEQVKALFDEEAPRRASTAFKLRE
jgi:outer membrane protein assembly factor BamB